MNNKYEQVNCPTCGDNTGSALIYKRNDGIGFYKCLNCNIEYASPRLIETELLKLYEGDDWKDLSKYNDWTYQNWKDSKGSHYYLVKENIKLIKKFLNKDSSILDVGCDIGL